MSKLKLNEEKNEIMLDFILGCENETADKILVEITRDLMEETLYEERKKGKGGWFTDRCNNELLRVMLDEQLRKGHMIDVINLAAMIIAREALYGETA